MSAESSSSTIGVEEAHMKNWCLGMTVAVLATFSMVTAGAQRNTQAESMMAAAQQKENVEGDLLAAIKQYKDIATRFASNHTVAATALLRLAECYQKLGDAESRKIYQEVISKYGDQKAAVEQARARLAPREMVVSKIWSGSGFLPKRPSPDGRYFVYISAGTSLVLHDISSDTDLRSLALGGDGRIHDPYLTPDGKRVIYSWDKDDTHELKIVNLDGTGIRTLLPNGEYTWYETAGVTKDCKLASVGLKRADNTWQIGLVPLETGKPKILKNLDWRDTYVGNFSPDGRWLVYSTQLSKDAPDDRAVYVIATDGSVEYTVAPRGVRGDDTPRFTPDGSRVVFISNRSDGADLWSVRVTDGKPGAPEIAKHNIGRVTGLGFDQDGSYYFSEDIGPAAVYALGASGVYVADVDPSTWKAKNVPALISDPIRDLTVQALHWSPDGKRLAYLSDHWPVIHDFESGKDRVVLTHVPKEYLTLRGWYSGGLIVGPPPNCRLIDTETQQQRPFPVTSGDCPVASADGKALFYTTNDSAPYANGQVPAADIVRLVRRDLETGVEQELYHAEAKGGRASVYSTSPDGRFLIFSFTRPGEKSQRQWILPLSGGEPREFHSEGSLNLLIGNWTPDSRALLFERSNEIWVQPIDGREPYGTGINFSQLSPESVSPDGSRIAFLKHTPTTHTVQMIKNLFPEASAAKR